MSHYRVWCPDESETEEGQAAFDTEAACFEDAAEVAAENDFDYTDPFFDRTYHVRHVETGELCEVYVSVDSVSEFNAEEARPVEEPSCHLKVV